MEFFNNIRQYFKENKIRRAKKEERKLPKKKGKGAVFVVWAVIFIIILLSPLAFLRAQTALTKSKNAEEAIHAIDKEDDKQVIDEYSSPMLEVFSNDFVNKYMSIPKESDKRKQHQESLEKYVVEDVNLPVVSDFEGYRKLKNKTLYNKEFTNNNVVMSYLVEYTDITLEKEEKTKGKGKKKKKVKVDKEVPHEKIAVLNIPVQANENGGYGVVESPYFTDVPNVVNNSMDSITNPMQKERKLKMAETDKIRKWMETFLSDYASKPADDLTYIMDEPKGLNGLQEFESITDIEAYPSKKENLYTVKVIAIFKEKNIPVTHHENFTFLIEERENKFFVKEMKNTIGGK